MRAKAYFMMVVLITVLLVYGTQQITSNFSTLNGGYFGFVLIAVYSIGAYTFTARATSFLLLQSRFLRRIFLGTYFLEGTWVGFVYKQDGSRLLVIEHIEQTIDHTFIKGKSFDGSGTLASTWESRVVSVDVAKSNLTYTYDCRTPDKGVTYAGVAEFTLERGSNQELNGFISGYLYDFDQKREQALRSEEIKFADTNLLTHTLVQYCMNCTDILGLIAARDQVRSTKKKNLLRLFSHVAS